MTTDNDLKDIFAAFFGGGTPNSASQKSARTQQTTRPRKDYSGPVKQLSPSDLEKVLSKALSEATGADIVCEVHEVKLHQETIPPRKDLTALLSQIQFTYYVKGAREDYLSRELFELKVSEAEDAAERAAEAAAEAAVEAAVQDAVERAAAEKAAEEAAWEEMARGNERTDDEFDDEGY